MRSQFFRNACVGVTGISMLAFCTWLSLSLGDFFGGCINGSF